MDNLLMAKAVCPSFLLTYLAPALFWFLSFSPPDTSLEKLKAQILRSDFLGSNPSSTIFSSGDFGQAIHCLNVTVISFWKQLIVSGITGHNVDVNIEFLAWIVLASISLSST